MTTVPHFFVSCFLAFLNAVVWEKGGVRPIVSPRKEFSFGLIIPLYCGIAMVVFPLVLFENTFRRPIPFGFVCIIELLCVLAFLYVSSYRISIRDRSVVASYLFSRKIIPIDDQTTIEKHRLLGAYVLRWNGEKILVVDELPGVDILVHDISEKVSAAKKVQCGRIQGGALEHPTVSSSGAPQCIRLRQR